MGIRVYSLLWVMQDLYHQPYEPSFDGVVLGLLGFLGLGYIGFRVYRV